MKKTINNIIVTGKRVMLRLDLNVPLNNGVIADDNRIKQSLPTIKHLQQNGAKLIIVSHLGRPKGEKNKKYSLKPVAVRLSELLGKNILFSEEIIGESVVSITKNLKEGEILLLENIRFFPQEENNDEEFAKQLSELADFFVLDAFGTAHRKHASTYGVAKLLPNAIGFLVEREIEMISQNIENPKRPFVAILGGAKVSDKIGVIKNLINNADSILVGGAMAYTLLKSKSVGVGDSLVENDMLKIAKEILLEAENKGVNLLLPTDHIAANSFNNYTKIVNSENKINDGFMGLDIGANTIIEFSKIISTAGLVVWNGPMGVFEDENFENGTKSIAKAIAESCAISIIGGGDSAAAVIKFGYEKQITHISTGGGASLHLIEGKKLPALQVIEDK